MKALQLGEELFGVTHDAEVMERSALKQGKNFVRREWTCELKGRFGQK